MVLYVSRKVSKTLGCVFIYLPFTGLKNIMGILLLSGWTGSHTEAYSAVALIWLIMASRHSTMKARVRIETKKKMAEKEMEWIQLMFFLKSFYSQIAKHQGCKERLDKCPSQLFLYSSFVERIITSCSCTLKNTCWWKEELGVNRKGRFLHLSWTPSAFVHRTSRKVSEFASKESRWEKSWCW